MNTSPQEGDLSFSVQWNKALKILFAEFAPAALTSIHGSPVHIEALNASDLSLSACAKFCYQYLKMKSGDLAIVNDPSSGGSSLDEICLVKEPERARRCVLPREGGPIGDGARAAIADRRHGGIPQHDAGLPARGLSAGARLDIAQDRP